jgi:hypothetical protein
MTSKHPSPDTQALLLKHLAALRGDFIKDLMRENSIEGLSNNKPVLLDLVHQALLGGALSWPTLIAFLDKHEPFGKQRVEMLKAPASAKAQYSSQKIKAELTNAGLNNLWDATVRVAAPAELELSSVRLNNKRLDVVAIGRRSYRQRVAELESQVTLPRNDLEVQLYEHVEVRAWIRAELYTNTGALNVRAAALPQERVQKALFEDFVALTQSWFPWDLFATLDLAKAIKALHADEAAGGTCEAMVQAVEYDDASGRKTALRSASANQSVNGAAPQLQTAINTVRSSGEGSDGNFYFLPTSKGGPPGVPIGDKPVRAVLNAKGRVDIPKPVRPNELRHVLRRIRVLAT